MNYGKSSIKRRARQIDRKAGKGTQENRSSIWKDTFDMCTDNWRCWRQHSSWSGEGNPCIRTGYISGRCYTNRIFHHGTCQ